MDNLCQELGAKLSEILLLVRICTI